MTYSFGGFQRFNSARSASMPAASIFAQSAGGNRMDRNTMTSSGGFGGLPRGLFSCSMPRTVAPIYRGTNNHCIVDLSCYSKYMDTITMHSKPTARQLFVLREYLKPWSPVTIQAAYNQSVWNLQRKGLMRFNEQRGRYEVTPEGVAAVEAEKARRSAS